MAEPWTIAAVVAVLVAFNGLFVAAEFAIIAAPRPAVAAAARRERRAALVERIQSHPRRQDRYIATAQVGITLASLGLGMYGEHALAAWLAHHLPALGPVTRHAAASVVAVAALTYLHIVLGEMVPKALALQHAVRAALALSLPMRWSSILFMPLVVALNAAGNGVLRVFGVRRDVSAGRFHSAADLRFAVEESRAGGALRDEEGRLLREAIDFSDATAAEAMVPRVSVTSIPLGATAQEAESIVRGDPHTRYPVHRQDLDHVLGVVHVKDILRLVEEGRRLQADDLRRVPFVPSPMPLADVLARMRDEGAHLAVVMDEHGGTAGILTIEDLLEEIVGDIEEEPHRRSPGVVRGTLRLEDLGARFDRDVSNPDAQTVSGLVLALLGRPPVQGDVVRHAGLRFEVLRVVGRGVRSCRVGRLGEEDGGQGDR